MRGKRAQEEITDDKKHKNQINIDERIRDRKTQIRDGEIGINVDYRQGDRHKWRYETERYEDMGIRDREIGRNVDKRQRDRQIMG